jgi:hypothetical protein
MVKIGDTIRLLDMPDEPSFGTTACRGDIGKVIDIEKIAQNEFQLEIEWENPRNSLFVVLPQDKIEIIEK